ncbi:MAG: hypothetical protein Q8P32_02665 [Candidatus Komeilibacteria bacterium]|nr:hypothetical protein [Candidatus Komeilibacteria bacterium]
MEKVDLKSILRDVVEQADSLKNKYTDAQRALVNYACIFCQNDEEYSSFIETVKEIGKVVKETEMGPVFQIEPIATIAGNLRLLKIRKPDVTRPERGDADFTVADYNGFKEKYLFQPGFKLLLKDNFEMIELMEEGCDVRVYFSNPPLDKQLGLF